MTERAPTPQELEEAKAKAAEFIASEWRVPPRFVETILSSLKAAESENEKLRASLLEAVGALELAREICEDAQKDTYMDVGDEVFDKIDAALKSARGEGSGWLPIESAPKRESASDPLEMVLIAWTNSDGTQGVGEAYWHPEDPTGGGWWWANTSPGDYFSDCVENSITGRITHWRSPPPPPEHQAVGGE